MQIISYDKYTCLSTLYTQYLYTISLSAYLTKITQQNIKAWINNAVNTNEFSSVILLNPCYKTVFLQATFP